MRLLIGTGNPAKLRRYQIIVGELRPAWQLHSLHDLPEPLPVVIEDGTTAREKARKKALAYARHAGFLTLGIDEALAIPALSADQQPGVRVRRYGGRALDDAEMLEVYLAKTRHLPASQRAVTWTYALCLALPHGEMWDDAVKIHAQLLDRPRLPIIPGYPLSSLLASVRFGKPLHDLAPEEQRQHLAPLYERVAMILRRGIAGSAA